MATLAVMALGTVGLHRLYKYRITDSVEPDKRQMSLKNGFVPTTVVEPWHEHDYVDLRFDAYGEDPDKVVVRYQNFQLDKTNYELQCPELRPLHRLLV